MRQRFAPSPTGYLHLGHAFSALTAWQRTSEAGGEFLLRIEDIDGVRSKPVFEDAIFQDLHWLGLSWQKPVLRQSERLGAYANTLARLIEKNLCFPCSCSRKDITNALSAPQENAGPDGPVYPGTCRNRAMKSQDLIDSIRLSMERAVDLVFSRTSPDLLGFWETGTGTKVWHPLDPESLTTICGDVVLSRKDIRTSYHLAVVTDDAEQGITHVTRGEDMFASTQIHVLLQKILGFPTPEYHHHRLIRDDTGKRLAKRDDARSLRTLKAQGADPEDIRILVGLGRR